MIKKQQQFLLKGMNRDISETKVQSDFAYTIKNLRIVNDEKNGSLSLVTENGTTEVSLPLQLDGKKILNITVADKYLIFFCKGKTISNGSTITRDYIYKCKNFGLENPIVTLLYSGNLNFSTDYPIKTYVSYENEKTIKVYWVDGLNQPRVINVAEGIIYETFDSDKDNHFDFCTPVYCDEEIIITKSLQGGLFHSGVIQYFVTYVDKNNQESKIFYQSPLYYLTDSNRALSPEENSTCVFNININNIANNNLHRKSIRVYSLHRTSLDATPVAKLIADYKLKDENTNIVIVDDNRIGQNIDPNILLLLGCDEFVPKTMEIKDSTIFFGNIKTKNRGQASTINSLLDGLTFEKNVSISTRNSNLKAIKKINESSEEAWQSDTKEFQLNGTKQNNSLEEINMWNINGSDNEIKGFMYQEDYMLGVQLLHKNGEWSEPIWVCDKIMTQCPVDKNGYHDLPYFYTTYNSTFVNKLVNDDYVAIRPLIVFNDYSTARVLCCGILNPVIKYNNLLLSSWFFRPVLMSDEIGAVGDPIQQVANNPDLVNYNFAYINSKGADDGTVSINSGLTSSSRNSEIDCSKADDFKIMNTWRTFNSPEIEFEKITNINNNYTFYACGEVPIHHLKYDIDMITSTSTEVLDSECGFDRKTGTIDYMDGTAKSSMTFVGGTQMWYDKHTLDNDGHWTWIIPVIYPWHNNVSYSGTLNFDGHNKGSELIYGAPEKKTLTNWRISQHTNFRSNSDALSIKDISVINESSTFINGFNYLKDVDILVVGGNYDVGDVRIQYKSTPHAIIKFDTYNKSYIDSTEYAALVYGYLRNKDYDLNTSNHFKGRKNSKPTETSMYENVWYIAGETKKLLSNNEVVVRWTKGDTYYQRYNCLKTYPFTHEAKNSVIDICSFMVQTRINIDGTYDKQKTDILHIEPENFNKLNDVYSQTDNFFVYHKLDPDRFQNNFPNLITWSKQKVFGEAIDSWTNMHLINVLDLDGNLGEITALKLWNNKLISFQNKGISVIKYNENVMIPSTTGAPIELMNSGLVSGKEYITNQFGCQNEWSIVNAKSGLYFSDDYNHKIYVLSSDGFKCISDTYGFRSYLKNKNYSRTWELFDTENIRTFYDQKIGDIYFNDGVDCLTYNENLNLFTSFYSYTNKNGKQIFDLIHFNNESFWFLNDSAEIYNEPECYRHRSSNSLSFFGSAEGYEVEIIANIDPHLDKIFDTVEIRGDSWEDTNLQSGYGSHPPFNKLKVSNEYQDTDDQPLTFTKDLPSNVKQKFRIWRAQIGRDKTHTRDRIRDIWSRIKLTRDRSDNVNGLRAKIHDIIVNVYE